MSVIERFSTSELAGDERLAYWNALTHETYPGTHVDSASPCFRAEMRRWTLGDLVMIRPCSEASVVQRRGNAGGAAEERLVLHLQHRGRGRHAQRRLSCELQPGDFSLSTAAEPYRLDLSDHELLVVELPRRALEERLPRVDERFGRRIAGGTPGGRLFHDFLLSLWQQGIQGEVDADCADSIAGVFLDLLALAARAADAPAPSMGSRDRMLALVDARLGDPDFGTAAIAEALGISVRSVQNGFAQMATTPSAHILERRLQRAAERLVADPGRSVTAIAFDLGFNDSAYFARCFRQRFGVAPSLWRQRH